MRLKNIFTNEFGQTEGTAYFPYFDRDITVICREGVPLEYAESCLAYLEEVDETLILQICKYAEYFLKDTLENTSVGELDDEESFPYEKPLDLLQYMSFETLYIEKPSESIENSDQIKALNLSGGCDWWEDEGLQCLVRDGRVIYLGYFGDLSVWGDYSRMRIGNYVLYESHRESLQKPENKAPQLSETHMQTQQFYDYWNGKGHQVTQKINHLRDRIAAREQISPGEAIRVLETTYLYELMKEYPQLLEESVDFWFECYCIEKETDMGEMVCHICENCEWDM